MVKCALCKKEVDKEHSIENCPGFKVLKKKYPDVRIESYRPSLKETEHHCPDCGNTLKELVPDEYFWCKKCDIQWTPDELTKQS